MDSLLIIILLLTHNFLIFEPKSEKLLYAPGPGSFLLLVTESSFLGDRLNVRQRLF